MHFSPLLLAAYAPAYVHAQQAGLDEIIVTAQKREESLQNVPISVQALGTQKLQELKIESFDDYANLLPSVSFVNIRPGFAQIYMRGVASGGDADQSLRVAAPRRHLDDGPSPRSGRLDVPLTLRVEALAGPQGTLCGAGSSQGR
jgi:outer membrane receptor protein involved in Fe transport